MGFGHWLRSLNPLRPDATAYRVFPTISPLICITRCNFRCVLIFQMPSPFFPHYLLLLLLLRRLSRLHFFHHGNTLWNARNRWQFVDSVARFSIIGLVAITFFYLLRLPFHERLLKRQRPVCEVPQKTAHFR